VITNALHIDGRTGIYAAGSNLTLTVSATAGP
jgi:hypothetical protein